MEEVGPKKIRNPIGDLHVDARNFVLRRKLNFAVIEQSVVDHMNAILFMQIYTRF